MRRSVRWSRALIAALVILVAGGGTWLVVGPSRSAIRQTADAPGKEEGAKRAHGDAASEGEGLALTAEKREALGLKVEPVRARVAAGTVDLDREDRGEPGPHRRGGAANSGGGSPGSAPSLVTRSRQEQRWPSWTASRSPTPLADLAHSESALALAEADYERERLLVEGKIGARKDFLRAGAALQQARVQRDRTRDKLRLLGVTDAMLADAPKRPGQRLLTPLLAPFRGTVIERQRERGPADRRCHRAVPPRRPQHRLGAP